MLVCANVVGVRCDSFESADEHFFDLWGGGGGTFVKKHISIKMLIFLSIYERPVPLIIEGVPVEISPSFSNVAFLLLQQ